MACTEDGLVLNTYSGNNGCSSKSIVNTTTIKFGECEYIQPVDDNSTVVERRLLQELTTGNTFLIQSSDSAAVAIKAGAIALAAFVGAQF